MNVATHRGAARKWIAAGLVALLPVMLQPVAAQELVPVAGSVFAHDTGSPLAGARVHFVQTGTNEVFTSSVTAADGSFAARGLPAATYEAAIEIDGGVYIVQQPVVIQAGSEAKLNLLVPQIVNATNGSSKRAVAGSAGFMSSPLAATLLVLGSALSIGALIDSQSDDDDASPF